MDISFSSGNYSLNSSGKEHSSKKNDITNKNDLTNLDYLDTSNFLDESNFSKGGYSKIGLAIMNQTNLSEKKYDPHNLTKVEYTD